MDKEFKPDLTPKEMLELGVFGGAYFKDIPDDLPFEWFEHARLAKDGVPIAKLNFFETLASQPHSEWQRKGWINPVDPLGWFQWYCRYYNGRRLTGEDSRQIKRWRQIKRHAGQIKNNCQPGDLSCRRKQRQALLHWAYDSRKM